MSKFNIGDQVRVIKGSKYLGEKATVIGYGDESYNQMCNTDEQFYVVKIKGTPYEMTIKESYLQLLTGQSAFFEMATYRSEHGLNTDIDGSGYFVEKELKPKFKVGDVVDIGGDWTTKHFIKEVKLVEEDGVPEYVYETGDTDMPDATYEWIESIMDQKYHSKNWERYVEAVKNGDEDMQLKLEHINRRLLESGMCITEETDFLDYSYYYEMAGRIPEEIKVGKKGILIVAIGADENRGEAHFHIFRNKNDWKAWKNGACLLFKENKYFDCAGNRETLTRDELKALVECLNSKPKQGLLGDTYWQHLISLWNSNNPDLVVDIDTPMPDYNYDTITRYKG